SNRCSSFSSVSSSAAWSSACSCPFATSPISSAATAENEPKKSKSKTAGRIMFCPAVLFLTKSSFHRLAWLRLKNFNLRPAQMYLRLKPRPRRFVAVAQQNRARRNPPDELQQILPVRVRRQIKILHVAGFGHAPRARTEHKRLALLRRLEPARR